MSAFIERTEHLDYFNKLRTDHSGAAYILQGAAGVGKSILLRQCRLICKKENHDFLYLDLEKFLPASSAAETIQNFGKAFNNWLDFQTLIKLFKTNFPSTQEIINHYQHSLIEMNELKPHKEKKVFNVFHSLKFWKKDQQNQLHTNINHPELFLLDNLKRLCQNHPVIFIDAYEQLYENTRLINHRLQIVLDFHGTRLVPLNQPEQPLFVDWLDALLEWLVEQGAIIVIAGRYLSKTWQRHQIALLPILDPQPFLATQKYNAMINKENILDIQPISGTYLLILEAKKRQEIKIGSFGKMIVEKGFYIYVGSAFGVGGLHSRIKRQLQPPRKKHWHIDYLRSATDLKEAWFSYDQQRRECEWAISLSKLNDFSQPIQGFGSSDCKTCFSHLFYCKTLPIFKNLQTHFLCEPPLQRAVF
jgi:Uri superfamily endonuclease